MADLNIIGKSFGKKDSLNKVLGKAQFAADIDMDNMLYCAVLRSKVASAILKNIDTSKAKALPGVASVLTYKDIPGGNRIGIILKDEPVLVDDEIRRKGDALAIVAAETKEIAEEALKLISVEYEELDPIFNFDDALKEDAHKIHGDSNILQDKNLNKGNVDEAFKECDVIVENTFKTGSYAHMYIEPEAGIAKYEDGIMNIWCSTQNPHFDRGEVARMLALPQSRVRVIQATTGGGFGGKLDISVQCHIALLAYYTGRPVKLVVDREVSMKVSSKRHPMTMKLKTGAKKDGIILALDAYLTSDSGAYASYGPAVITRAMTHITGPYEVPNVRVRAVFAYTNSPMCGAFRGFGVPQAAIAHEGQMDILAEKLGMSPIEIRLKNALRVGGYTPTNQLLTDSIGIVETIEKAVKKAEEVIYNDENLETVCEGEV